MLGITVQRVQVYRRLTQVPLSCSLRLGLLLAHVLQSLVEKRADMLLLLLLLSDHANPLLARKLLLSWWRISICAIRRPNSRIEILLEWLALDLSRKCSWHRACRVAVHVHEWI